jgi:DNA-binding NarL/FixJ family response regulator
VKPFKREADFDVCGEAENGREAIDQANSLQPDLIVMDFSMPVLNGLEAARLLRNLVSRVPVIIYPAHDDQVVETEALAAGRRYSLQVRECGRSCAHDPEPSRRNCGMTSSLPVCTTTVSL